MLRLCNRCHIGRKN